MTYDAMNRGLRITNPVGGIYRLQYNAQGLPVAETDEDGRVIRAEFDNLLRITKQVDGLGNTTEYSYNIADGSNSGVLGGLHGPTETKYPTSTQRQRYDALERPTSNTVLNPNRGGTQTLASATTYDRRGQVSTETDANGKARGYARNAFGQLIEATDHLGQKTRAQYDARGNLIQLTDANGSATTFAYDRNDRVVKETLPLGQSTSYRFDASGNLAERIDPNGAKTVYTFDAANRLIEVKHYKAGTQLQRTTTYTFDAADNLIAWRDTDASMPALGSLTASSSATYDAANRKTAETITYPAGNTLSYGYGYSAAGTKTQLTWPDGTAIGYAYSDHGELQTVTIPGEGSISVNQYKWFAPAKLTLPGGATQDRTLDGLLNLEGLSAKTPGQQTVLSLTNVYGLVQELKTSTRTDAPSGTGASSIQSITKSASYTYDDETRLIRSVVDAGGLFGTDTETFTLDAVANRLAHSRQSGAWTYDANHRLTQRGSGAGATSYQYDDAGNLIKKTEPGNKVTQFGYDTQNRLVEVKDGSGKLIARYGYDPMHRRIWKEQYRDRDGNALNQAVRTSYLYADEGLIAEATQAITLNADQSVSVMGEPGITTQYGPRPNAPFTTGTLFIKTKNSNGEDTVGYYHRDHLETPIQATDKSGHVVWAASYNVFGQASITTPAATVEQPTITSRLRLPGQIDDAETGLHYNYFRYYDAEIGRYITSDPIGLHGGVNRYAYVNGNPLGYYDPYGLLGMDDVWGGVYWATGGWSPSQNTVDFGAGFGDVVTFGLTRQARSLLDINNVNRCSNWYTAGEVAGLVATTATGFVGGTRWFARQASPNNWSNFSHSGTPASWQRGSWWSRTGNRANGDYIPTTGTRPDLHDLMDATAAGIGGKYPTWPAWRRAINRMPYTPGGALYGGASAAMNACECSQ